MQWRGLSLVGVDQAQLVQAALVLTVVDRLQVPHLGRDQRVPRRSCPVGSTTWSGAIIHCNQLPLRNRPLPKKAKGTAESAITPAENMNTLDHSDSVLKKDFRRSTAWWAECKTEEMTETPNNGRSCLSTQPNWEGQQLLGGFWFPKIVLFEITYLITSQC